jgi:hypothetical protein
MEYRLRLTGLPPDILRFAPERIHPRVNQWNSSDGLEHFQVSITVKLIAYWLPAQQIFRRGSVFSVILQSLKRRLKGPFFGVVWGPSLARGNMDHI